MSRLMFRFVIWSVGSVLLAIAVDLGLRNWLPWPSQWLDIFILAGVTVPMLLLGGAYFFRRAQRQEWALRRHDARQWLYARRDPLTLADNRQALKEVIAALNREPVVHTSALFVLDLHDFQRINDACGHQVGDQVLREVARRLRATLSVHRHRRAGEDPHKRWLHAPRLVRVGSDELALWFSVWNRHADPEQLAREMLATLDASFQIEGLKFSLRGCVGYVIERSQVIDGSEWLTRANTATQQAKRLGAGHAVAFAKDQIDAMVRRHGLHQALQESLKTGAGFRLEYQPIVSLELRTLMGCEALLRWKHPEWGQISPAEFVPVAESSDLIRPLGRWVLSEAVRQLAEWQATAPASAMLRMKMSVNLSRAQLHDPALVQFINELLRKHAVAPSALRLEVTESLPLDDRDSIAALQRLRMLGVTLALDDFGTGYSSLSALLNLPIRSVKIDRQFVSGIDTCPFRQALVSGVLRVAEVMNLDVVAEGVEREEESETLHRLGCHYIQGWLVSRSLPPTAFADSWLQPFGSKPELKPNDPVSPCQKRDCELNRFESCPKPCASTDHATEPVVVNQTF